MRVWLFALGGVAAGAAQAGLLKRALGRPNPFLLLVRTGMVGVVLLLAARAGQLVAGAAGWFTGFAAAAVLVHRRLR
ncbi:MAG TPA: hypothetical protein VLV15_09990 [Dongiaceae bacterium]|nr:hypothetical protein [Dongiaceae bacterium]